MAFIFYYLSCQSGKTDSSEPGMSQEDSVLELVVSSEWSSEDVEFFLEEALQKGLPSLPHIRDVYAFYLQQRTYLCPTMENPNSTNWVGVWQSYCVSDTGYTYEGQALYSEDISIDNGYFYQNMVASFLLISPEDHSFLGGGEFESLWDRLDDGSFFWEARVGGTYRYSHSDDWLQNGESSLFWTVYGQGSIDESYIDGGIGYHSLQPNVHVFFEKFAIKNDNIEGQILIRDPSSYWWVLSFDSEHQDCSNLFFDKLDEGQICVGDEIRSLLQNWFEDMNDYVHNDVFTVVE